MHRIEVIIGVHVCDLLISVVALAIKPVLRLQSVWEDARAEVVEYRESYEEGDGETLIDDNDERIY